MSELFNLFEQICIETSIPLDTEIKNVDELLKLIEDHENYIPQTKACRQYKHVINSLMKQAYENLSPIVVSELSELVFAKLHTCSINQIQYEIRENQDGIVQWIVDLQYISNFKQYLETCFPNENMDEIKEYLDSFYNN